MKVRELRALLADVPGDAIADHIVVCSPGGGELIRVTATANGMVILDAEPRKPEEIPPG